MRRGGPRILCGARHWIHRVHGAAVPGDQREIETDVLSDPDRIDDAVGVETANRNAVATVGQVAEYQQIASRPNLKRLAEDRAARFNGRLARGGVDLRP